MRPLAEKATARSDRFTKFFLGWVLAYPALWLIGIGGLFWVVLGLVSLVFLVRERPRGLAVVALLVACALALSSVIGTLFFGFLPERLASLGGNILVWVSIAAALCVAVSRENLRQLTRSILILALFQGALSAISAAIAPSKLPVPLLAPIAGALPSGFAAFSRNNLYFESWLDGFAARSAGLNAQPTWAGAFAAIALIIAVGTFARSRGGTRVLAVAAGIASWYSIQLSLSRSTWISLGVAVIVLLIVWVKRHNAIAGITAMIFAAICGAIVLLTRLSEIQQWLNEVNAQREGSAETRGAIYQATWGFIAELPIPLLGFGIKPQDSDLVASVATHSTYLGLLFRGGIVALVLFVIFLVVLLAKATANSAPESAAIASLLIMWCIFEDIDPGHLVPLGIIWAVWSYRVAGAGSLLPGSTLTLVNPQAASTERARAFQS